MKKGSGILLHPTSLPGAFGIGAMGREAGQFLDFLAAAGQSYWQVLPIGPPAKGDSPYSSLSSEAGNPLLIDLEQLVEQGLLTEAELAGEDWGGNPDRVDHRKVEAGRDRLLRRAAKRFFAGEDADFARFVAEEAGWLDDYALYMALIDRFGGRFWPDWPELAIRRREPEALAYYRGELALNMRYYQWLQYLFFRQWKELRASAVNRGIRLIGDLPIYVPLESVEVWLYPECFRLDAERRPLEVSGFPPDYFNATGQFWNTPVYDWPALRADGYRFWLRRTASTARFYDFIRLDHFRGFESYWSIPAEASDARKGKWCRGPGLDLIARLRQTFPETEFIAEDLGLLTEAVRRLLKQSGLPGMNVLQFAFGETEDETADETLTDHLPRHAAGAARRESREAEREIRADRSTGNADNMTRRESREAERETLADRSAGNADSMARRESREEARCSLRDYPEHSVCYTGTHDNNTIRGYIEEIAGTEEWERAVACLKLTAQEGYHWGFIRGCLETPSRLAVIPMQDVLNLPAEARMNIPGTTSGNWRWRLVPGWWQAGLAERLRSLTKQSGR